METLKYKIITNEKQYYRYCDMLQELVFSKRKSKWVEEEIELLTLLIEKYDEEHNSFPDADPIKVLRFFMDDHKMKVKDRAELLGLSESYVSGILNYKQILSTETIKKLTNRFKVSPEAFNRFYKLKLTSARTKKKPA